MENALPEGHPRILVVDDEPSLLRMMGVYLKRLGYSVTASATTEQALQLAKNEPGVFAVAVLDATMAGPGMEALASELLRANPTLRVLAASGYPVDMTALEAVAPGRVAFLHKPFSPEMLAGAVGRMLAAKKEEEL